MISFKFRQPEVDFSKNLVIGRISFGVCVFGLW